MFDENKVATTKYPRAKRLRKIFCEKQITTEDFSRRIREDGMKKGHNETSIRLTQNNVRKAVVMDHEISLRVARFVLVDILGMIEQQATTALDV
jgi:hypothetical protein